MPTPTYDLIASNVLSSSASSVTFSSLNTIAATYRDLVIVAEGAAGSSTSTVFGYLNSDTNSNYNWVRMQGDGSSAVTSASSATNQPWIFNWGQSLMIVQYFDFAQTDKHKNWIARGNAANARVSAIAGRWANTNAVTSITLQLQTGTFAAGSTFYLYGIA